MLTNILPQELFFPRFKRSTQTCLVRSPRSCKLGFSRTFPFNTKFSYFEFVNVGHECYLAQLLS